MTNENDKDKGKVKKKIADESHLELSTSPNTYRENEVLNKSKEKDMSNIYCGNCGNIGHVYRKCRFPITSCGVILYKINPEYVENKDKIDRFLFLLIQRKDTLGYIEFLRGKYDEHNLGYITKLIETMTKQKMIYSFSKKNRVGDHICYISDISKFRKHYPKWRLKYSLKDMIKQIIQEIKK